MTLQSFTWKQAGIISLWRYTENQYNYPGWHLTADTPGCTSLLALLDAISSDGVPCSRALRLTTPSSAMLAVPGNGSARWVSASKLRFTLSSNASQWTFPDTLELAELTVGSDWIPKLRQAIAGISQGTGDFSIGCQDQSNLPLWFWWHP